MKVKTVGRFVVTDPDICHGEPVFRGTRILVADVLEQVASGMAWEAIAKEWRGSVTPEAITEAAHQPTLSLTARSKQIGGIIC
jgi:uncharacterized protein (DUF433 family)